MFINTEQVKLEYIYPNNNVIRDFTITKPNWIVLSANPQTNIDNVNMEKFIVGRDNKIYFRLTDRTKELDFDASTLNGVSLTEKYSLGQTMIQLSKR